MANKGTDYEHYVKSYLQRLKLLPSVLKRNDAGFIHKEICYFVELKILDAPDYGQKGIKWSSINGWEWREKDIVSDLLDKEGVREYISTEFIPRKHSILDINLIDEDKKYDQQQINEFNKMNIRLANINILYEYYARKECFYIQIEGRGFYYLKKDIANLNVPQFTPQLTLRLRAKTHHSEPIHKYSFFAVLQANARSIHQSPYDLDEKVGKFPPIVK